MKYLVIAVSMLFSSIVVANGPPEGTPPNPGGGGDATANASSSNLNSNLNSNTAYGGAGGDGGTGVGIGVGKGGDASSYSGVRNNNTNVGINAQKQGQGQEQGQYQGNVGVNKATGSGNSTTIRSNADVDAEPAIAPSVQGDVSNITCFANVGGSVAGGGVFAFGIQAVHQDEQCTYRANAEYIDRFFGREIARDYAVAYFKDPKGVLPGNDATEEETAAIQRHDKAVTATETDDDSTVYRGDQFNPYGL